MTRKSRDRPASRGPVVFRWLRVAILDALRDTWALLMPVDCAGCESPDRALCAACSTELVADTTVHSTPRGIRVFAALRYEGPVRRIVLAFKDQQRTDLARPLAEALLLALRAALGSVELLDESGALASIQIVAVPSSRSAFRSRGYHPIAVVLRAAGVRDTRALRVVKATGQQKMLNVAERARNAHGALVATRWLGGAKCIVVDDVLTTGATIDEAARAIIAAGGTVIGAATIGFTPRRPTVRDIVSIEG